ncbi:hypothetical protein ACWF5S_27115 [Peribacillus butanolivorans]
MMMKNGHKYYFMKLVAILPVQVGYGKNSNELTGALLHYQQLLLLWGLL